LCASPIHQAIAVHEVEHPASQHQMGESSELEASTDTDSAAPQMRSWRKGEILGVGSHGRVFKAQSKKSGHIFVVKESTVDSNEYCDRLRHELEICHGLDHPNIVRCLGHEYCDHHLYIRLEYVPGGSLRNMLAEFGPLSQELMPIAMHGLLEGLEYLHTRNPPVVHRDIKSSNVLVDQNFCVKLSDFGCSKCDNLTTSFTTVGSVLWMAPEVIRGKSCGGHGRKADVWSLGCVFLEMATAEKPWSGKVFDNVWQAMKFIDSSDEVPAIPDGLPSAIHSLIGRCLRRSPSQRPWASELLAAEVMQSVACRKTTSNG
jgi:serine/threonine protein kinase